MDGVWTKIISADEHRPDETLTGIDGDKRTISDSEMVWSFVKVNKPTFVSLILGDVPDTVKLFIIVFSLIFKAAMVGFININQIRFLKHYFMWKDLFQTNNRVAAPTSPFGQRPG